MAIPWLRVINGLLGASDLVRLVKGRQATDLEAPHGIERKLTGVVVAALKEAFDRDYQRLDIERQRLEEERLRSERAMRLELLRQAGEREIQRLRLLAGIAALSLLATMVLVRLSTTGTSARVSVAIGWTLLVAAIGIAFSAQGRVAAVLGRTDDRSTVGDLAAASSGGAVVWLMVAGLALVAAGLLLV